MFAAACGGGGGGVDQDAAQAHGPIKIWYSNNEQEIAWGKQMVAAWNAAHPNEQVTAEEIPAGKSSEEVIGAAITAGTEPCLIYNTSPAAVPGFQKQGGLVDLARLRRRHVLHRDPHRGAGQAVQPRPTASTTSCRGSPTR